LCREHGGPCDCPVLVSLDNLADGRQPPVPHRSRSTQWRVLIVCWIWLIILGTSSPAQADQGADKAAIIARLEHWASAFNERDIAGVCDLFSRDLISTVSGALAAGHDTVCRRTDEAFGRTRSEPQIPARHQGNYRFRQSGDRAALLDIDNHKRRSIRGKRGGRDGSLPETGRWSVVDHSLLSVFDIAFPS
jgi:hypothetical protein